MKNQVRPVCSPKDKIWSRTDKLQRCRRLPLEQAKLRQILVTLQTFYLGKHDLLTVYLGKLGFLSVTDFSLGNLPRGNFIVWGLDMSREQ